MPRTGRPAKPVEEHRRNGTYRADRHGTEGALAVMPNMETIPRLDPKSTLEEILEIGVSWLGQTDAGAVAMLRETLEERAVVRERAMAGSSEARKELRDLDKQVISLLSALGFDPSARARLGVAEVKRASALDELIEKRSARS